MSTVTNLGYDYRGRATIYPPRNLQEARAAAQKDGAKLAEANSTIDLINAAVDSLRNYNDTGADLNPDPDYVVVLDRPLFEGRDELSALGRVNGAVHFGGEDSPPSPENPLRRVLFAEVEAFPLRVEFRREEKSEIYTVSGLRGTYELRHDKGSHILTYTELDDPPRV